MNTLIKLNENHYVIVDDSEIKVGDYYLRYKKITHSTQPLDKSLFFTDRVWGCEKLSLGEVKEISLQEVKELIGEVDVEKKMISPYPMDTQNDVDWCNGYQRGYNQALEDNKEKKYTEEDIKKAIEFGHTSYTPFADVHYSNFIQSLQPKTEWEVAFIDGKIKLI